MHNKLKELELAANLAYIAYRDYDNGDSDDYANDEFDKIAKKAYSTSKAYHDAKEASAKSSGE